MSDSLVCCCLCLRDIEKSYERVNLERCRKDFDSLAEIESLDGLYPHYMRYLGRLHRRLQGLGGVIIENDA